MSCQKKLAVSASLKKALQLCRQRLDGESWLKNIQYLNLGFFAKEPIPTELPALLAESELRVVVHCIDLNLTTVISTTNLICLKEAASLLNVHWFEEDVGIWLWGGMFLGSHQLNPVQSQYFIEQTANNVQKCHDAFDCPFLIENPPVYYVEGKLDMWHYLYTIATKASCGLVLDVGHIIGYLINTGQELVLPASDWSGWSLVRELHLSGFDIYKIHGEQLWIDRHSLPFNQLLLEWTRQIIACTPNLELITLEQEGAPEDIVRSNLFSVKAILEETK